MTILNIIKNLLKKKKQYQYVVKRVGEVDVDGRVYTEEALIKMASNSKSLKYENGRLMEIIKIKDVSGGIL